MILLVMKCVELSMRGGVLVTGWVMVACGAITCVFRLLCCFGGLDGLGISMLLLVLLVDLFGRRSARTLPCVGTVLRYLLHHGSYVFTEGSDGQESGISIL